MKINKTTAFQVFLVVGFSMLVSFQNCSTAHFESSGSGAVLAASSGNGSTAVNSFPAPNSTPAPVPTVGSTPGPVASATPLVAPTPVPTPQTFNPVAVAPFTCLKYVSLDGKPSPFSIPAQDSTGTCYTLKIISSSGYSPSSKNINVDMTVVSANHDSGGVHHPYLLGQSQPQIFLQGKRSIKLAGAANDTAAIAVDNFLLLGVYPVGSTVLASDYKAFGTSDSQVGSTGGVLLNGNAVPLTKFATGGTASVTPVDLSAEMSTQAFYQLDVRAEDCGGSGGNSDIYLLFK